MSKTLAKAMGLAAGLAPLAALAQTYSYDYSTSSSDVSDAAAAGIGIGLILVWIVAMVVGLAFFILWVVMLVDCVKRDFEQRGTWLAVLIVGFFLGLSWLAAIIYYFVVKRKNLGTKGGGKPAAPAAPAAPQQ